MNELEKQFYKAMVNIYTTAKEECDYTPTRFLQMLGEIGGVATARSLILKDNPTEGFVKLWELKRLDLTVEALVLQNDFKELFTDDERAVCKRRLKEYGYAHF